MRLVGVSRGGGWILGAKSPVWKCWRGTDLRIAVKRFWSRIRPGEEVRTVVCTRSVTVQHCGLTEAQMEKLRWEGASTKDD